MWGLIKGESIFKKDYKNILESDQQISEVLKELETGKKLLNLEAISQYYSKWIKSAPFDVGHTTRQAFNCLREKPSSSKAYQASIKKNEDS